MQDVADVVLRCQPRHDVVHDAFTFGTALRLLEQAGVVETDRQTVRQFARQFQPVLAQHADGNLPFDDAQHLPTQADRHGDRDRLARRHPPDDQLSRQRGGFAQLRVLVFGRDARFAHQHLAARIEHEFLPCADGGAAVALFDVLKAAVHFLIQAGVLNGDRDLVRHRLQNLDLFLIEGITLAALHVQRADHARAHAQRHGKLGTGVWQELVALVNLAHRRIAGDYQPPLRGHLTDHADRPDAEAVSAPQQFLTHLARAGAQQRVLPVGVDQENLRVVDIVKAVDDQVDHVVHQPLQVTLGGGEAADLLRGIEVAHAGGDARLQRLNLPAHLIAQRFDIGRQRAQFIAPRGIRHFGVEIAERHRLHSAAQAVDARRHPLADQQPADRHQRQHADSQRDAPGQQVGIDAGTRCVQRNLGDEGEGGVAQRGVIADVFHAVPGDVGGCARHAIERAVRRQRVGGALRCRGRPAWDDQRAVGGGEERRQVEGVVLLAEADLVEEDAAVVQSDDQIAQRGVVTPAQHLGVFDDRGERGGDLSDGQHAIFTAQRGIDARDIRRGARADRVAWQWRRARRLSDDAPIPIDQPHVLEQRDRQRQQPFAHQRAHLAGRGAREIDRFADVDLSQQQPVQAGAFVIAEAGDGGISGVERAGDGGRLARAHLRDERRGGLLVDFLHALNRRCQHDRGDDDCQRDQPGGDLRGQ